MYDFWKDDLTEDEEEALIDRAAGEITKRKLNMPAMLFFEMHKPLSNVAGNAALMFSPFLVPFFGFQNVNDYSRLLQKPDSVERLIQKLEDRKAERAN